MPQTESTPFKELFKNTGTKIQVPSTAGEVERTATRQSPKPSPSPIATAPNGQAQKGKRSKQDAEGGAKRPRRRRSRKTKDLDLFYVRLAAQFLVTGEAVRIADMQAMPSKTLYELAEQRGILLSSSIPLLEERRPS